jgi:hypothetical protein
MRLPTLLRDVGMAPVAIESTHRSNTQASGGREPAVIYELDVARRCE